MSKKKKKKDNKNKSTFWQRMITIIFCVVFIIVLCGILCFEWIDYCNKLSVFLPNIVSLLFSIIIGIAVYLLFKRLKIDKRHFILSIIIVFGLLFILQGIMLYFTYFYTGWDASVVNALADSIINTGAISGSEFEYYLSLYPNNILIVAFLTFIKSIPILGNHYFFLLIINALLVNLAGLFTCLSIEKLVSKKASLLSIFIIVPLIIFSPWIIIPYSDSFAILFPVLMIYIYLACNKFWKYGLIIFLGLVGYFIKPTVIIVAIAIILVELLSCKWSKDVFRNKNTWKNIGAIVVGIVFAFGIKAGSNIYINFQQDENIKPMTFIHYLAMGQNNESCGAFLDKDVIEAQYGVKFEFEKFYQRISERNFFENVVFYMKKMLLNFNDGSFAWSREGEFYKDVPNRDNDFSEYLASYFYYYGDNNNYFRQIVQMVWLLVLFGCVFIVRKPWSKPETIIQLSLIGIFVFLMIFEARARYLFCYAPIFIICAICGYNKLKSLILMKYKGML